MVLAACAVVVAPGRGDASQTVGGAPLERGTRGASVAARNAASRLSVEFEENAGQADPSVRFVARAHGYTAFVQADGVAFALGGCPGTPHSDASSNAPRNVVPASPSSALRMRFVDASSTTDVTGAAPLPGRSNYFIGNDPLKWRTDVPHFGRVLQRGVRPGIDVVWRAAGRDVEYDVVVAAGADPAAFSVAFDGAARVSIDRDGSLAAAVGNGVLRSSPPTASQDVGGARRSVAAAFAARPDGTFGFAIGEYDRSRELVIDPMLGYGSYVGGASMDIGGAIAVDADGNLYLSGQTNSLDFPIVAGALQSTYTPSTGNPPDDAYVSKISADGTQLVYSTYLGGSGFDEPLGMRVDATGAVFLGGQTSSANFPAILAMQATYAGGNADMFVTKIAPSGAALAWSGYLGGSTGWDACNDVALDADGNCYLGGYAGSTDFPVRNARQPAFGGGSHDGVLAKVSATGTLLYATYHGGSGYDNVFAIAVDAGGALYSCGLTASSNFPVVNALYGTYTPSTGNPGDDAFVSKLNSTGSALAYSTYLGGSGYDEAYGLAIDATGAAYVCGVTASSNFPTKSPYQAAKNGGQDDVFLVKLVNGGGSFAFATYLGGSSRENGTFVAIDSLANVYVVGQTNSTDFPLVSPYQSVYRGGTGSFPDDAYVTKFKADGQSLVYSTYFGGSGFDDCYGCATDAQGGVYLTGWTNSTDFPTSQGALRTAFGGGNGDAYVVRMDPNAPAAPTNLVATQNGSDPVHLTWTDNAVNETGFEVERRAGTSANVTVTFAAPNATSADDSSLFPNIRYTYRVRAVNSEGASAYTNAASVITPGSVPIPPVPRAPAGLALQVVGSREIDVAWTDMSTDETGFSVVRRAGGGLYETAANVGTGVAAFDDRPLHAGWEYTYKVRAFALQGPSAFTPEATASTPGTMTLSAVKGTLVDSVKRRKDTIKVSGAYGFVADASDGAFDPVADGLDFQFGAPDGPAEIRIGPADPAWKSKKTKRTWTSAKKAAVKITVVFDVAKHTFAVTASGLDLAASPAPSVRLLLASADDGGAFTADWIAKKGGKFVSP